MIPAGLQSLMGGKNNPVPQDLNALLSAQRVLQEQAKPTTPDGRPTIAAQTEQAIAAQTGQADLNQGMQQPEQQPMPGMMPSDPFKDQLMKTLQMQAQQQMAQMGPQPPQEMAEGGIASLPAENMEELEYAEGGVMGFAGEDRSDVPNPDEITEEQKAEIAREIDLLKRKQAESRTRSLRAPAKPTGVQSTLSALQALAQEDRNRLMAEYGQRMTRPEPTPEETMRTQDLFRRQQGLEGRVGAGLESLIKEQAAREQEFVAEREKSNERRGMETWMQALAARARGPAGSFGEAVGRRMEEQRDADLKFKQLLLNSKSKRDEMAASVQTMREAAANNNQKLYSSALEDYRKEEADLKKIDRQIASTLFERSSIEKENEAQRQQRMREIATKSTEQQYLERLAALKLNELTGGKPENATVKQRLEANEYALTTIKGAGKERTSDIQAQRLANDELRKYTMSLDYLNLKEADQPAAIARKKQELMSQFPGATFDQPSAGADIARPTTMAEMNALPKGARYINPADGRVYQKN